MNALRDENPDVTGEIFFNPDHFGEIRNVGIDTVVAHVVWDRPDFIARLLHLHGVQKYRAASIRPIGWGLSAQQKQLLTEKQKDAKQVLRVELELARVLETTGSQALVDQVAAVADGITPDHSCFSQDELEILDSLKEENTFFAIARENMPGMRFWERITSYEAAHERSQHTSGAREMPSAIVIDVSVDYL